MLPSSSPELHSHAAFFDLDHDGILWPTETFFGFRSLGYNLFISLFGMTVIHLAFSLVASIKHLGFIPDPLFRLQINKMHKAKHGSDTESYTKKGKFDPSRFDEMFETYTPAPHDSMSFWEAASMVRGQSDAMDPFGWTAASLEWLATYLLLWPADGRMKKDQILGVYDGSVFYKIAETRKNGKAEGKKLD
ncbi:Caleosin [Mrakia frigida]|uniref:caleosin family protein n=1 Tax=Mrakia frigida TaxID=29902 RepID=UPI003FCC0D96